MTPIVLLLALAIQSPAATGDLQLRLADVRTSLNAGQIDQALEQLKQLPPDDVRVRYLTGVAYYHRDDPARAIDRWLPSLTPFRTDRSNAKRPFKSSGCRTTWRDG